MNILLIFFAIPLAIIILSAILESFINCPIKVAGIFFSIFIVLAFAFGGTAELIAAAIIYTVLSFVTAVIIRFIIDRQCNSCNNRYEDRCNECNTCNNFAANTFALNNNLNRLTTTSFGLNNEVSSSNVLPEEASVSFSSNNSGNFCRRCR